LAVLLQKRKVLLQVKNKHEQHTTYVTYCVTIKLYLYGQSTYAFTVGSDTAHVARVVVRVVYPGVRLKRLTGGRVLVLLPLRMYLE